MSKNASFSTASQMKPGVDLLASSGQGRRLRSLEFRQELTSRLVRGTKDRPFKGLTALSGVNYSFSSTTIIFPHRCLGFSVRAGSERSPVLPVGQHD